MHYHSPRAYEFLRETFNNHLPHPSTIRAWYSNSDLNTKPNVINERCISILAKKVEEKAQHGEKLVCAVLFDEIHIRKHIQWSNTEKKLVGFANTEHNNNQNPDEPSGNKIKSDVANQALVFMVSSVNDSFQLPMAYYFINSMKADEKQMVVESIIEKLMDCGIIVSNVAFDGFPANATMCKLFGANLNVYSPSFKPYLTVREKRVYILYDSCHMIKLIRNRLSSQEILFDPAGKEIRWQFLIDLVRMKNHGFTFTHKMNQSHINWRQKKMKVDLAVQALSESTASAMEYLLNTGIDEFAGSESTIEFIRIFNTLFDVFNSKNEQNENIFKRALCIENAALIFNTFDNAIEYIKGLKVVSTKGNMIPICKSIYKTGFIGFIINMHSLKLIFKEMMENQEILKCAKTYYMQQDPVEILFGKVRSLGRNNCNPTCEQFSAAFRKLLGYNTVMYSKFSNCNLRESASVANPYSDILSITSRRLTPKFNSNDYFEVTEEEIEEFYDKLNQITQCEQQNDTFENLNDCSIAHVAKLIEDRIKTTKQFHCLLCKQIFEENTHKVNFFIGAGLVGKPCHSTFQICKQAERFLKIELLKGTVNFNIIHHEILQSLHFEALYDETDFSEHFDHKIFLIRFVVDEYVRIKGTHIARTATFNEHQNSLRSKYHKLLHYLGQ